ncbi:hypothetical protein NCC49_001450 [Naganishia albida]|nr:hypothetical protein NCC49_001450 [Naganishia albida]
MSQDPTLIASTEPPATTMSSAPPVVPPRARGRRPAPLPPSTTEPSKGSDREEASVGTAVAKEEISSTPQPDSTAMTTVITGTSDKPISAEAGTFSENLGASSEETLAAKEEPSAGPSLVSTKDSTFATLSNERATAELQRLSEDLGRDNEDVTFSMPGGFAESLQSKPAADSTPVTVNEGQGAAAESQRSGDAGRHVEEVPSSQVDSKVTPQPDQLAITEPVSETASELAAEPTKSSVNSVEPEETKAFAQPEPVTPNPDTPVIDDTPTLGSSEHTQTAPGQPIANEDASSTAPVEPAAIPLPHRASSSFSSHSASSTLQSRPSTGGDTSCSTSTSGLVGLGVGTPESRSNTRVDVEEDDGEAELHTSRLGVEDDMETFGRKMSYAGVPEPDAGVQFETAERERRSGILDDALDTAGKDFPALHGLGLGLGIACPFAEPAVAGEAAFPSALERRELYDETTAAGV